MAYIGGAYSGLRIIDVSNPAAPTEVGSFDTPGQSYDVQVVGSLVYVADDSWLRIIDVSNPAAPTEVGSFNTPADAWNVQVVDDLVYVADMAGGLQILRVLGSVSEPTPTPTTATEATPTPTPTVGPPAQLQWLYLPLVVR